MRIVSTIMFVICCTFLGFSQTVIHYWNFNNDGSAWTSPISADIGTGSITWTLTNAVQAFSGTTINAESGDPAGYSFCPVGNTDNGNYMEITLPTTGYENLILSYATRNTSTGFQTQEILYTTDGTNFTSFTTISSITTTFALQTVDFSSVSAANDNSNFIVRIVFDGATGATGNNRIDNLKLTGSVLGADNPPEIANFAWTPKVPDASTNTTVTATVTDDNGLSSVDLKYFINGGTEVTVAMTNTIGDEYSADIPSSAYNNGDRVEFYVYAVDNAAQPTEGTHGQFFAGTIDFSVVHAVDGQGVMLYIDYYARLTGVATVANGVFSSSNLDIYIQDGSGGINVFAPGVTAVTITPGNSYTVIGVITQYNGKAEIIPDDAGTDITDNGAATLPAPSVRTIAQLLADPETYEGTLVGIQHCTLTAGTWPTGTGFVNVTMDDGTGTLTLRINNVTAPTPEPTWPRDIVGILLQFDSSLPYTDGYQWMSRAPEDFLGDGSLPIELTSFTARAGDRIVTLRWVTESEKDNVGFEIMRSNQEDGNYDLLSSYVSNEALKGQLNSNQQTVYKFVDKLVGNDITYWYKLVDVDLNGVKTFHGPISATPHAVGNEIVNTSPGNLPRDFALQPNYPNPFNPSTTLSFDVPQLTSGNVEATLYIYNSLGQQVKILYQGKIAAGNYKVEWDGTNESGSALPSGIYYATLRADYFTKTIKMMYMK